MALDPFALQYAMDPEPIQTRLLNDDDREHLTGASARFLLQMRKPRQQAGHIAATHAVFGHCLPGPGRQGRDQPHRTTEFQ